MILLPVLNPGPGAKGRRGKKKAVKKNTRSVRGNPLVVSKSGKPLKAGGAAHKAALKAYKEGGGRRLVDGRVKVTVGGKGRWIGRATQRSSAAPKTMRARATQ